MQSGTEPIAVLTTIVGIVSEVIGLFSLYATVKCYKVITMVGLSLFAPFIGGVLWLYLCKVNGWPFYLGGPQNEPYGIYAFVWGIVTLLPVIFCVRLITSDHKLNSIATVGRWFFSHECMLVVLYVMLTGICALFFYGVQRETGIRAYISSFGMSHERTEQLIIVLWALVISVIPMLALLLLGGTHLPNLSKVEVLSYAAPALFSVVFCLLALAGYFALYDYTNLDQKAQVRGVIAGFVVRFSVFWGLWLAIDTRNLYSVLSLLKCRVMRPFT